MTSLTRLVLSLACAFVAAHAIAAAQVTPPERHERADLNEIEAFLSALPQWSTSVAASVGYGYKDNLLLSFAAEERSPFVRGTVELFLLRVPQDRFDFSLYAEAGGSHYLQGKTVDDDAKAWVQLEPAYRVAPALKLALPVTGYYYDQVFDVSDTQVERLVAEMKVGGVMVAPLVRWDFLPSWWVEAQGIAQRKRYDDRANDGELGEGVVRLGWAHGRWFEVRVTGAQRWRDFDSRTQYTSAGRELPDTLLKVAEREGELRFDITWDEAARWETTTRMSVLEYRDNGSGYFNFREQRVAQELEWTVDRWQLRVGGSAARVDFDVQTVGIGIDPPSRLRDEFVGELHLGRKLSQRWTIFGGYTWERSRSNDRVASYTVNEGLLGMRWSWEK